MLLLIFFSHKLNVLLVEKKYKVCMLFLHYKYSNVVPYELKYFYANFIRMTLSGRVAC